MTPHVSARALWRSFRRIGSTLLLLLLIAIGTGAAIVVQSGRSAGPPADAAIVMLDEGGASTRLDRARLLYTDGKIGRLLLAGRDPEPARTALLQRGIREEAVVTIRQPSQAAQLTMAGQVLSQEQLGSALLIAEPVETLRLLKIASDHRITVRSLPLGDGNNIDVGAVVREIGRYYRYVLLNR